MIKFFPYTGLSASQLYDLDISETRWQAMETSVNQALETNPSLPYKLKRNLSEGRPYSILLLPTTDGNQDHTSQKVTAIVLLKDKLGAGGQSKVKLGLNPATRVSYAVIKQRFHVGKLSYKDESIKVLEAKWAEEDIRKTSIEIWNNKLTRFRTGVSYIQQLQEKNPELANFYIPRITGAFFYSPGYESCQTAYKNSSLAVLERASYDLFQAIDQKLLEPQQKPDMALHLLHAIEFLHANKVAHLDIKPENVLVYEDPKTTRLKAKITDFEFAQPTDSLVTKGRGSLHYLAPELSLISKSNDSSHCKAIPADLWSLGVTLHALFTSTLITIDVVGKDPNPNAIGVSRLKRFASPESWTASQEKIDRQIQQDVKIPSAWKPVLLQLLRLDPTQRGLTFPAS